MEELKIHVIVDNNAAPGFEEAWGLSILIEANGLSVLFDADTSPGVLCRNAWRMGVSLRSLDFAVLSHWHHDHYGGFQCVARAAPGLVVYTPPGPGRLVEKLAGLGLHPVPVVQRCELSKGFTVVGPLEAWAGFYEQGLLVTEGDKAVLIVGCSHPGVDRLAEAAARLAGGPLDLVIGGFHEPSWRELDRLLAYTRSVAPLHCTGNAAVSYLATMAGRRLLTAYAGTTLQL